MKKSENDFQLIERFLDGTLSDQENADFHARVESDPEFARHSQSADYYRKPTPKPRKGLN
ncbi:MAG: hypothetical protein IPF68_13010 [Bacteroidales bacterium]|nr:hypothetical protein [Bacteroidales bacterium]